MVDTPKGLVIITGCGHAGIANIVTFADKHFVDRPIYGIVGGLHLFAATDDVVDWTASKLREFHVANLLAAHCTGIEATFRRFPCQVNRLDERLTPSGQHYP